MLKRCHALFFLFFILLSAIPFTATGVFAEDAVQLAVDPLENSDGYLSVLYDNTNGLPTAEANAIAETPEGFIWIGSYSGLIRYDGNTFERIDSTTGIASVRSLFVDSKGRLWIGTNDSGVFVMSGNSSDILHYSKEDGLTSSSVRSIVEDKDGNIYLATAQGLALIDKGGSVSMVADERIEGEYIPELRLGADGAVYGVTNRGAAFTAENGRISTFFKGEELRIANIYAILPDADNAGYVYLGTHNSEIYYGKLSAAMRGAEKIDTRPMEYINSIEKNGDELWVCADNGIGIIKDGQCHVPEKMAMDNAVEKMLKDYQGNLWFVSSKQGVMKLVANQFTDIFEKYGVPEAVINTTCSYEDKLFIGCKDNGLIVLDDKGVLGSLPVADAKYASGEKMSGTDLIEMLKGCRIRSIYRDSEERLWISMFGDNALLRYDGKDVLCFRIRDGLPSDRVRTVFEREDGSFLVACTGGVAVIEGDKVTKVYGEKDGIGNTETLSVTAADKDEIVLGTDGGGIYIIKDGSTKYIGSEDGLMSEVVMRVKYDDKNSVYWIVTSNSIAYMDRDYKVNTIRNFPYPNNFDLYENSRGEMWILSSDGIYVTSVEGLLDNEEIDTVHYGIADGVSGIATANSYSELESDGDLYIACTTGVLRTNIDETFAGMDNVKLSVPYLEADGVLYYPDETGAVTLPSSVKKISIYGYVFTYSLMNPVISYRLEGLDESAVSIRRNELTAADYTNLSGGSYRFVMQLLDAYGKVRGETALTIVKKYAIYEHMAVRVGLFLLVAALSAFIVWRIVKVTIISRQYEQIRAAKEEAERANNAKSRFLANMSHEIRTPINTIMGMDEMILREDTRDIPVDYAKAVTGYATDIKRASGLLLGLVNDVLDLSKIESGKMNLVEQDYDTEELLRSIITMIRVRSDQKGLSFDTDIDASLPRKLRGDAGKIKQVILNLLTNAVKYTEKGGFTLMLAVEDRQDDKCLIHFAVKDTGIGVKPEDIDKLFSAFERLEEERNSAIQGTGLGLDISKQFVSLMGGELSCDSVYGEGSTFYFSAWQKILDSDPIGEFSESDENKQTGAYVPLFSAPDGKVLIVDDNDMNLQVIKGLLKGTDLRLTTASGGQECLDKLKEESFHIVLLDHMMPDMDGIETLAKIREDFAKLPVIALTANSANDGGEFYKEKGFQDYLAKPVDGQLLEKTLAKYLPKELLMEGKATDETAEELPESLSWLYDTEGINVSDGIAFCGGVDSFIKTINIFNDSLDENSKEIEDAYHNDDIGLYTIKVHALKSGARIIGAAELSELSRKLEDAGNDGDLEFIAENTDRLLTQYREYKERLRRLKDAGDAEDDKEPIPEDELAGAYEALREVIPQMDYDSVEMILEQVNSFKLPEHDKEIMEKLAGLLKKLDWDGMESLV